MRSVGIWAFLETTGLWIIRTLIDEIHSKDPIMFERSTHHSKTPTYRINPRIPVMNAIQESSTIGKAFHGPKTETQNVPS